MQYIQLQPQIASQVPTPDNGSLNFFLDVNGSYIKIKNSNDDIISSAMPYLTGVTYSGDTFTFVNSTGGTINLSGFSVTSLISVTYEELFNLKENSQLNSGSYYLINDYQTCYDQPDFDQMGNPITEGNYKVSDIEPLMVLATSENTLSHQAFSLIYPLDKITYDISFNTTEVTNNPAKGRITERIDNFNNRTDYDFRNVLFKRYEGFFCETYLEGLVSINEFGEVIGEGTDFQNDFSEGDVLAIKTFNSDIIGGFIFYEILTINSPTEMLVTGLTIDIINSVTYSRGNQFNNLVNPFKCNVISRNDSTEYRTFETDCFNTYIGDYSNIRDTFLLSNNVFLDGDYTNNYFGQGSCNNTFDDDMNSNVCDSYFRYNIITNDFDRNRVGCFFERNIIECDMADNIILNNFENNMLGDRDGYDFDNNTVSSLFRNNFFTFNNDDFRNNIVGENFYDNIIDSGFINNNIKGNFYNNKIILNFFEHNTIDYSFYDNTINRDFTSNRINRNFYNNDILGCNFENNIIGANFYDNNIYNNLYYNQIGYDFNNNTIGEIENQGNYNFSENNISTHFKGNIVKTEFLNNKIDSDFESNIVLADFINNTIGENSIINTFSGVTRNNKIGNGFSSNSIKGTFSNNIIGENAYSNQIDDDFGFGFGEYQGNIIGNNFNTNNIGEYFYNNVIPDNFNNNIIGNYFQWNTVKNYVNSIDFTLFYGNILTFSYVTNGTTATDGTYNDISSTSDSEGIEATFNIIVSGGQVINVDINNSGKFYQINDTLTILGENIGGTSSDNIIITVDSISTKPSVYEPYSCDIFTNSSNNLRLSYYDDLDNIVIKNINE